MMIMLKRKTKTKRKITKKTDNNDKVKDIDEIKLLTADDWKKYADIITKTITTQTKDVKEDNKNILTLITTLIRTLSSTRLKLDDVNELKKTISALCNDKIKSSKDPKEVKKKIESGRQANTTRSG